MMSRSRSVGSSNRVCKRSHNRHFEIAQQLYNEAAALATEYAIFMLYTDHTDMVEVKLVGHKAVFI